MTPGERATAPPEIAPDDRTSATPEALRRSLQNHLHYTCAKDERSARAEDLFRAMARQRPSSAEPRRSK